MIFETDFESSSLLKLSSERSLSRGGQDFSERDVIKAGPKNRSVVRGVCSAEARCTKGSGIKAMGSVASRVKESFVTSLVLGGSGPTIVLGTAAALIIPILLSMARGKKTCILTVSTTATASSPTTVWTVRSGNVIVSDVSVATTTTHGAVWGVIQAGVNGRAIAWVLSRCNRANICLMGKSTARAVPQTNGFSILHRAPHFRWVVRSWEALLSTCIWAATGGVDLEDLVHGTEEANQYTPWDERWDAPT